MSEEIALAAASLNLATQMTLFATIAQLTAARDHALAQLEAAAARNDPPAPAGPGDHRRPGGGFAGGLSPAQAHRRYRRWLRPLWRHGSLAGAAGRAGRRCFMMTTVLNTNGLRWFDTSPPAGDPECICSHCDEPITEGEMPIRLWNEQRQEARLHRQCFAIRTGAPVETDWQPAGPCCACRRSDVDVRNLIMLPFRAPQPGTGWGCVVCGLPSDGAIALVCDACLEADAPIRDCCEGYTTSGQRASVAGAEPFDHRNVPH